MTIPGMVAPLFRDDRYQSLFAQDGFVKVPLLSGEQVDALLAFFDETREGHQVAQKLHHTSTDTRNADLIYRVDSRIKAIFGPALDNLLSDYKALAGTYHIKETGTGSATGIHQDPTFVDETDYCSANVWVALHDIDAHNGNLFFVKGSHRAVSSLRITPSFPGFYEKFREELPQMLTHVPLKKGEAVIFNNATIHGATDNSTNRPRLAATLLVCSAPAQWLLYYRDEHSTDAHVGRYVLDMEAFVALAQNGKPGADVLDGYVACEFPQLELADFEKKMGRAPAPVGYLQRIKAALGLKTTV